MQKLSYLGSNIGAESPCLETQWTNLGKMFL
jgi:hypothetical protein